MVEHAKGTAQAVVLAIGILRVNQPKRNNALAGEIPALIYAERQEMIKQKNTGDIIREYRDKKNLTQVVTDAKKLVAYIDVLEETNAKLHETVRGLHKVIDDKQSRIVQMDGELAGMKK